MLDPIVVPSLIVASAMSFGLYADSIPPHRGAQVQVEQLYKDNGRIVALPILDTAAANERCPGGSQLVRQTTRSEGGREYLLWTLRCL